MPPATRVNLWMATLSPDDRRTIGPPEQLTFGTGRITDASVSGSGTVVFATTAGTAPAVGRSAVNQGQASDKGDPMAVVTNRDFTYLALTVRYRETGLSRSEIRQVQSLVERPAER